MSHRTERSGGGMCDFYCSEFSKDFKEDIALWLVLKTIEIKQKKSHYGNKK